MKKGTKFYYITIVVLIVISAWTTIQSSEIRKTDWLIGTWENKTSRGIIFETWTKMSDNELFGKSYFINEKDTVVFETIRLVQKTDGLFYIPTVKNQNDGLPVRFAAKSISETQLVFENPQHDFPQVISYTKITPDSLVAEISGMNNGQERKLIFPMKRVN